MRKAIYLVLLTILLVTFSSCGGENKGDNNTKINETEQRKENTKEQDNKESEKEENNDELSYLGRTYREPDYKVAIDGPNHQSFFEKYSQVWNADRRFLIVFGAYKDFWHELELVDREAIKTLEDIIPNMKEPIIISSQGKSYAKIEDIVITEQEKVTVNGMETNRFVGYFDCPSSDGSVNDRYIVGYTFFIKEEPGYLLGTVTDIEQYQKHI